VSLLLEIEQRIQKIIRGNFDNIGDIGLEDELSNYPINSIDFVKLMVAIENEFGFSFKLEDLSMERFPNLKSLVTYITEISDSQ
jgi:acyl carrier protein